MLTTPHPALRNAKSGMPVDAINRIWWAQSEPGTDVSGAISRAYDYMSGPSGCLSEADKDFTVTADAVLESESKAFSAISKSSIAKGIKRMMGEYIEFNGQRIESFEVKEHKGRTAFDLWINLGEDNVTPRRHGSNSRA